MKLLEKKVIIMKFYLAPIIFLLGICSLITNNAYASNFDNRETPVVLKSNNYYILYTYPKAPYIDSHDRLIVPLRSVSELFGAKVEYDAENNTALIYMSEVVVKITIGSRIAFVNGKPVKMDTVAVIEDNAMLVPIRILIDSFKIKGDWNQVDQLLTLNDERLMKTGIVKDYEELGRRGISNNNNAFLIKSYRFKLLEKSSDEIKMNIEVTAKNITGKNIPSGKEDISQIIDTDTVSQYDYDMNNFRERPAVKVDEIIKMNWEFPLWNYEYFPNKKGKTGYSNLEYIFVESRVFD